MCGRFELLTDLSVIVERFAVAEAEPAGLAAGDRLPGQPILAVTRDASCRRLAPYHWGLIPAWVRDPAIGRKLFNARAETLEEKPSFREAFQRRRCLIPADGFYEWTGEKGGKRAVRFSLRDGGPFAFAGLYDRWRSPAGETIATCTVITTVPNRLIAPIHDRMPVILLREHESPWLDPALRDAALLGRLLAPYPAEAMRSEEAVPTGKMI